MIIMDEDYYRDLLYGDKFYGKASGKSFWRGYWYYKNGNVISCQQLSDYEYEGVVKSDSLKDQYKLTINLDKPRASKCNCPFAEGKYKVCKHMVALYFAAFPDEIKPFDKEVYEFEKEQEKKEKELKEKYKNLKNEILNWTRDQLENYVVNTMLNEYYEDDDYIED